MSLIRVISSKVVGRGGVLGLPAGLSVTLSRSLANARAAPAGKKGKGGGKDDSGAALGGEEESMIDHKQIDAFFQAAKDANAVKIEWSEEEEKEHQRIGREYNIQSFVRHQRLSKDLADKIWFMHEAIDALPEKLKAAAKEVDHSPPPRDRPWAMWSTPPIKGFDDSPYSKEDSGDKDEDEDEVGGDESTEKKMK